MSAIDTIVVVCPLALWRDCVGRVLATEFSDVPVLTFSDLLGWCAVRDWHGRLPLLVIFEIGNSINFDDLREIIARKLVADIIIISDNGSSSRIFEAINLGVKAYIPSDQTLEIAIKAIRLAVAGGVFLPFSSFLMDKSTCRPALVRTQSRSCFRLSRREFEVIGGISRGKSNAAIARDLNIAEATIKVHVRNIMKKMNVNTRTAIAFKSKEMPLS
ncbi:LuxR C-terminal-related transcriptional regulator [Labrys sp. La1]|uniref:LuxR C-terminal-related transcriptional regulator n=1 Tax=Labrys sp. La1 TaxID=3404917 RepID=UPI003EB932BC